MSAATPLLPRDADTPVWQAGESQRLRAVAALVDLARQLNDRRAPDHQERVAKAVASVREYFRDGEGDLPTDAASLLTEVLALVGASGSSPEGYGRAIDALAASLNESRNVSRRRQTDSSPRL